MGSVDINFLYIKKPVISPVNTLTRIRLFLTVILTNIPSSTDLNILSNDLLKGVNRSIEDGTDVNKDGYQLSVESIDIQGVIVQIECTQSTPCQDILDYVGSDTGKQSTGDEITEVCAPLTLFKNQETPDKQFQNYGSTWSC